MKVVVIGGTGLIGSALVKNLRDRGHEAISASPSSGVNTITGEGLDDVMAGTDVVVDVANSPSFADGPVMEFFRTSARNLLAAESAAGVRHHIALSVVGADRVTDSGYMRAKVVQESAIKASGIPYTIVRATQFFEFIGAVADGGTDGSAVRLPPVFMQPIAAADVSAALADVVEDPPVNGVIELAGPERRYMHELATTVLAARHDARSVVPDPAALYFDARVTDSSLTPGEGARLGGTRLAEWLNARSPQP